MGFLTKEGARFCTCFFRQPPVSRVTPILNFHRPLSHNVFVFLEKLLPPRRTPRFRVGPNFGQYADSPPPQLVILFYIDRGFTLIAVVRWKSFSFFPWVGGSSLDDKKFSPCPIRPLFLLLVLRQGTAFGFFLPPPKQPSHPPLQTDSPLFLVFSLTAFTPSFSSTHAIYPSCPPGGFPKRLTILFFKNAP